MKYRGKAQGQYAPKAQKYFNKKWLTRLTGCVIVRNALLWQVMPVSLFMNEIKLCNWETSIWRLRYKHNKIKTYKG